MFFCTSCKISKNIFFYRAPLVADVTLSEIDVTLTNVHYPNSPENLWETELRFSK